MTPPEPRRRSPNVIYVGDVIATSHRFSYRVTSVYPHYWRAVMV